MERNVLLAALLTFFAADLFGQSINSVTVSPQNPTSSDEVVLNINGDRWSSNTYISSITATQSNNTFTVDVNFETAIGAGLPVLVPFDTIVSLGTMTIGYYDATVNGNFNGSVQDFDGATWAVLEPTGIEDEAVEEVQFNCSPNPFLGEANLHLQFTEEQSVQLLLYDILGQQVATVIDKKLAAGTHHFKYFGHALPAGRYYFHLNVGGETRVIPVMKRN